MNKKVVAHLRSTGRNAVDDLNEKTLVVFRVWKEDGEVLALFPELPATDFYCTCYAHLGQHSSADYVACISKSRPAKPHEYKALAAELRQRGYHLKIVSRWQRARHKRR